VGWGESGLASLCLVVDGMFSGQNVRW
jgi:hypothetical protein